MATTFLKPRWADWENICIQKAFAQKIQHKIMAMALGRTVPAINKKIQQLGLRIPSSIRGCVKGKKQISPRRERIPHNIFKMTKILENYAPTEFFQKSELVLKKRWWTQFESLTPCSVQKNERIKLIDFYDCPFTLVEPMDFLPSKTSPPFRKGEKKFYSDPAYVSLHYVEQWANTEGFHKLRGTLEKSGLSYWKNGTYFSKTQLLMHVNRLRYEHNLQPLALLEDELLA